MSGIVVVTAVREETRAVLAAITGRTRRARSPVPTWEGFAGPRTVTVVEGGMGSEAARRAVASVRDRPDVLVSFGFAGALIQGLEPGFLIIAGGVTWRSSTGLERYQFPAHVVRRMEAVLPEDLRVRSVRGDLLSSPVVLATPEQKEEAGRVSRAVAVEMETATLAEYSRRCGVELVALRVILDPLERSLEGLPANLSNSWGARTRLVTMPSVWPRIAALRRDARIAAAALTRAAAVVLLELGRKS